MVDYRQLLKLASVLNALSGIAHIVAPGALTRIVQRTYDLVLAVDFQPRENTTRRVRLLGVLSLVLSAACYWLSTLDST